MFWIPRLGQRTALLKQMENLIEGQQKEKKNRTAVSEAAHDRNTALLKVSVLILIESLPASWILNRF